MTNGDASSDDIARGVGYVAIESARLEFHAGFLYAALLQSDLGTVVTVGQQWSTIYQSSKALARTRSGLAKVNGDDASAAQLDRVGKVLDDANALMAERADAVHGFWFPAANSQNGLPNTSRTGRFGKTSFRSWTLEQLADLRARLQAATLEVSELASWQALNSPDPWRE